MGLLGDFLPDLLPQDPEKREAAKIGLLSFGASMLAGSGRGTPWNDLGRASLAGLQGYQNTIDDQQRNGLRGIQKQALEMDLQTKRLAAERQKRLEEAYKGFYSNNSTGAPAVPGLLSDGQGGSSAGLLGGAPQNVGDNLSFPRQQLPTWMPQVTPPAPTVAPRAATVQPAANDNYSRHLQFAQYLEGKGLTEEAQKYYDLAEKFKPKINSQKTLLQNGRPVNVITYDDGTQKVSDFGALPDVQILNLGGKQVVVDKNTAKDGQTFVNTITPGEAASNQLGWANYGLSNRRFGLEQQQAAKPQYHEGFWVTPPTRENPNGTVVAPAGNNKEREANDVLSLLNQAEPLLDQSTGSYGGVARDMAAQIFGGVTDGAKAAAQLKALGGSLVSKMPKMSGPQSDKDVLLYKEMAGQIGDPTVPAELKKAAMQSIREINQRYSTGQGGMPPSQQPSNIPAGAVQMLKSNPSLYRAQFDKKYGTGVAASILGK